jgi:hypothetical protein
MKWRSQKHSPTPASIETWPVIGVRLKSAWSLASMKITEARRNLPL